jgi:hypothetical protein
MAVTTIREQIISAVVTALSEGAGIPSGLTVHRERTRAIEADSLPACLVYFEDDEPMPIGSKYKAPLIERDINFAAELRAFGSADVTPDQALDPLIMWTLTQLFLDESFGGLANGIVERKTVWNSKEGDVPLASATIHLTIKYRTSRTDPSAKA